MLRSGTGGVQMRLIEFNGAYMAADEDRGYKSSGKSITVIAEQVVAFYDHTILTQDPSDGNL